jgi:hypothetical protein
LAKRGSMAAASGAPALAARRSHHRPSSLPHGVRFLHFLPWLYVKEGLSSASVFRCAGAAGAANRDMAFVGRIIVIIFALFMAALAAGIATAIALLGIELHMLGPEPLDHAFFWGTAAIASGVTVVFGFLPILIVVILGEAFSIRSLLIHVVAGAAILLLGYLGAGFSWSYEESIDHPPPPISREAEIVAAVGMMFGFTYWLFAGRNAGRWREP